MTKIGLAIAATTATVALLAAPPATAQMDCEIKVIIYPDSVWDGGVCQGEGGVCANFYLECDGQPWPWPKAVDHRPEPGHLASPSLRLALLDGTSQPAGAHGQFGVETTFALAVSSCKNRSLFDRLDRRQKPNQSDEPIKEPRPVVSSVATAPAAP